MLARALLEDGVAAGLEQAPEPARRFLAVSGQQHQWQSALWHSLRHAPVPVNRGVTDSVARSTACKPGAVMWWRSSGAPRLGTRPLRAARPRQAAARAQRSVRRGASLRPAGY